MVPPTVNIHLCATSIAAKSAKSYGPPLADFGVPLTGSNSSATSSILDIISSNAIPRDFNDTITSLGAGTNGVDGSGVV